MALTNAERADIHARLASWFGEDQQAFLVSHLAPVVDRIKSEACAQAVAESIEMSRKADQAERRAEDAEAEVERLKGATARRSCGGSGLYPNEVPGVGTEWVGCPGCEWCGQADGRAMSAPRDLTATILRVLQRTADVQGNVTMLRAAENIAAELEARHVNDATVGRLAEIIASDAALVRVGQAEALREAARRFVGDMADAWGGDSQWLTTGTRVAEVVACVLREWAADLEGECSHEWLDRPESDTRECLICGTEATA